jgi:hypothetical protein
MLNVSTASVERAAVVQREGVPELAQAVDALASFVGTSPRSAVRARKSVSAVRR